MIIGFFRDGKISNKPVVHGLLTVVVVCFCLHLLSWRKSDSESIVVSRNAGYKLAD